MRQSPQSMCDYIDMPPTEPQAVTAAARMHVRHPRCRDGHRVLEESGLRGLAARGFRLVACGETYVPSPGRD